MCLDPQACLLQVFWWICLMDYCCCLCCCHCHCCHHREPCWSSILWQLGMVDGKIMKDQSGEGDTLFPLVWIFQLWKLNDIIIVKEAVFGCCWSILFALWSCQKSFVWNILAIGIIQAICKCVMIQILIVPILMHILWWILIENAIMA